MARPARAIDDPTPLDGARIDVGARVRWLLRVHRVAAGLSLADLAEGLRELGLSTSRATLSSAETGGERNGVVVDAYEHVLGLPTGQLRATVDIICRTFAYAPPDVAPRSTEVDRDRLDVLLDRAFDGEPTSGSAWLTLARALGTDGEGWLPTRVARPLADRLIGELVRSVGLAFLTRYEAVALLRCGRYADLVEDVARDVVLDRATQPIAANALSAVSEQPTVRLLEWAATLLCDPSGWRCRAAALGLENMRAVGGLSDEAWQRVAPRVLEALEGSDGDPGRAETLTRLFRNLPRPVRAQIEAGGGRRFLRPVTEPASWRRDDRNEHFAECQVVARRVAREAGLGEQPMLARLLFEAVYDLRSARVATAGFLLMASPVVDLVRPALLALTDHPDPATRDGALRAAQLSQVPSGDDDVRAWYAERGPALDPAAVTLAGNAGVTLPDEVVARVVDRAAGDSVDDMRLVEAMGLSQHPALARLAVGDDVQPAVHPAVREAARWWTERGGRVVD